MSVYTKDTAAFLLLCRKSRPHNSSRKNPEPKYQRERGDNITTMHFMSSIMSEGEQKVVALSHFVAENLLEDKDNVLVFDDPVNSLDLQRMENVAENLVKLSVEKQVIIFTHNLVFVGMRKTVLLYQIFFVCVTYSQGTKPSIFGYSPIQAYI